jgi:hypothetical protein
MSSKDSLSDIDRQIAAELGAAGLVDSATIAGATVEGYFVEGDFIEQGAGEDAVAGVMRTFDCRAEVLPATLEPEDLVTVEGFGKYRYLRSEPYGNGRVLLLLGSIL